MPRGPFSLPGHGEQALVVLGLDDAEAAAGSQDGGEHGGTDENLPERHLRRG